MSRVVLILKKKLSGIVARLNPRIYFTLSYLHNHKRFPNFSNPKDISEIWINRLLRGDFSKIYYLADKYRVRDFIKEKGKDYLLTPLLGVYSNAEEIDFSNLPIRFALKLNSFAGKNYICTDKNKIDTNKVRKIVSSWLDAKITSQAERHYNLIEQKIICEAFIDDGSGHFPTDYKFICLHGKVVCVLACSERETGHARYSPFTPEWEALPEYRKDGHFDYIDKPQNLIEMIAEAEELSEDFELMRVDLYSNGETIWFGEMTLTPAGCMFHNWSNLALDELGEKFRLTQK